MKSIYNKKGVFGLTSVQAFFAIIMGIALLAYVIVVIMGTLEDNADSIMARDTLTGNIWNETINLSSGGVYIPSAALGVNLTGVDITLKNVVVRTSSNQPDQVIGTDNYTIGLSTGLITGASGANNTNLFVNVSGTIEYEKNYTRTSGITNATGTGVTGFFSSIDPVYAILAILVIILVLIVLVRVVTGGGTGGNLMSGKRAVEPSL